MLVLLLTGSANAGIMQNESPAPPPAPAVQHPTTDGEMDTGATAPTADGIMQNEATVAFVQVVLTLLTLS